MKIWGSLLLDDTTHLDGGYGFSISINHLENGIIQYNISFDFDNPVWLSSVRICAYQNESRIYKDSLKELKINPYGEEMSIIFLDNDSDNRISTGDMISIESADGNIIRIILVYMGDNAEIFDIDLNKYLIRSGRKI